MITPKMTTVKATSQKTSDDDSNCDINDDLNYGLEDDPDSEAPGYGIDDNQL